MLKDKEIKGLITKLREKYMEYAGRYNGTWFNINAFEDRLQMALRNKMNIEAFALAEVTNFEKIKEKYENQLNQESFSDKVDKIMDEQLAMIKHYPKIDIHPRAHVEISYLYGGLNSFLEGYWPILWSVLTDNMVRNRLHELESELINLSQNQGSRHSRLIEDHILVLSRTMITEIEIEKHKNNYLKQAAFLLHDIIDFCDEILGVQSEELSRPVRFDKIFSSSKKDIIDIFSNCSGYGVILKIQEYCDSILENFRLKAFKRY